MKQGFVYIMSNKSRTTFYIGVTSDLENRVFEHKQSVYKGFTSKYKCFDLVYFEHFWGIEQAIEREKQLKNWHRQWKLNLITESNPEMKDLSLDWV
jgi:putative endonuclease